jgi:GAF domain-containing protein
MPTTSVVQILTESIAPVIVISGVGLLLLSISNRYGRAIDRARLLMRELESSNADSAEIRHLEQQLHHTHQRARLLRASMTYSSASIFFVTLTVLALFADQVFRLQVDFFALPFFALCLISLVISIYYSIRDISVSLAALEMQLSSVWQTMEMRPKA